jgi:putative ABC transport system permease protein
MYFKKLGHVWFWFIINTIGLSIAFACLLIIYLYARMELSYDRFHSKAGQIYRVTADNNRGAVSMHPARVAGDWPGQLMRDYPVIENMARLVPFRNAVVRIDDQKFYSQNAFSTDSSFFKVFDFKVLAGNPEKAFSQPGRAFICRSMAFKYFGTIDVIGKKISILHQQERDFKVYTIDGVMEDFPVNSHFHTELLTSLNNENDKTTWAYTYFLIKKGTNVDILRRTIQQKWDKEKQTDSPAPILYFQKLTDIHLYSHKTREMEKSGDIRSLILLVTGAFIILLVALINFLNLSRVRFLSDIRTMKVKMINGASKSLIAMELISGSLVLSAVSIITGLFIAVWFSRVLKIFVFQPHRIDDIVLIGLLFTFTLALLSVYPLLTSKIVTDTKFKRTSGSLYTLPLVVQFTLSVIGIEASLVLNNQMNFLNITHPASQNSNMVVIADNPWDVVQRYEVFSEELLKNPSVTSITAAMEKPGGDILDGCTFEMEGIEKKEGQSINIFTVDSNFFTILGIHPIAGTTDFGFAPSQQWEKDAVELSSLRQNINTDKQKISELEKKTGGYHDKYILNQSALKHLGIGKPEDAIGKRFRINFFLPDLFPEGEIVGVVPDFHYTNLHNEEKPLAISPRKLFNYCFLITINPAWRKNAIAAISLTWQKINPEFPLQYEYITDSYRKVYSGEYAQTRILSIFAVISVILSSLGIFAIAIFSMQQRAKEIGIRKVNGAKVSEILLLLNKDYIRWVAIAFAIATPIGYGALHKWLENFAYKTELHWWIFFIAGMSVLIIALLTISLQSWKAATRNPVKALRYE